MAMGTSFIAFGCFLGSILVACWAVTYGRSMVARARFIAEMTELRDEVEDLVFAGRLPDKECVEFLWVKAQTVLDQPGLVSMSTFVAVQVVDERRPPRRNFDFGGLAPEQRKLMHELEGRFVHELARYVVTGSRMWAVFKIIGLLPPRWIGNRIERRAAAPEAMAEDFSLTLETHKVHLDDGTLGVSTDRLISN